METCPTCEALRQDVQKNGAGNLPRGRSGYLYDCSGCGKRRRIIIVRVTLQGRERVGVAMRDMGTADAKPAD